MKTDGVRVIAAAITTGELSQWTKLGEFAHMLPSEAEAELHGYVAAHVNNYGKLPSPETVKEETGVQLSAPPEPAEFYLRRLRKRYVERAIRETAADVQDMLDPNEDNYDPMAAVHRFQEMVAQVLAEQAQHHVVDFRDSMTLVYDAWIAEQTLPDEDKAGLMSGWPSLDSNSGGLEGGEVMSVVGRPASGKSFFLLWLARNAWRASGRRPLVSTQEMSAKFMLQRLAAMQASVPLSPIRHGDPMDNEQTARFKAEMEKLSDHHHPLLIADGKMAATVNDLRALCQTMGSDCLYVDGAYLLQHMDKRLNRYQRVAENMDLLKGLAVDLDIPVICSWQFSREAAKKMKKEKGEALDLEDIGYSDAIGQHSSIVVALKQDEDAAVLKERTVDIIKGRAGETGNFIVNWNFDTCDFGEADHGGDVAKMNFEDHGL